MQLMLESSEARPVTAYLVITTKRGTGGLKLNYSGKLALSGIQRKYDVFDADEFRDLVTTVFGSSSEEASSLGDYTTDWQDEIYRNAVSQSHYISHERFTPEYSLQARSRKNPAAGYNPDFKA